MPSSVGYINNIQESGKASSIEHRAKTRINDEDNHDCLMLGSSCRGGLGHARKEGKGL